MARKTLPLWLRAILIFVFCLGFYQILSHFAGERLFPPLPAVLSRAIFLIREGALLSHLAYSAWRSFAGLAIAALIGIPTAAVLARFPRIDVYVSPLIYFMYPIPKVVFLPVLLLLLGLGNASKIAIVALISVFQVIIALRDAFIALDRAAFRAVRAFGGGNIDILRHVVWPASLPALFTALRLSCGTALAVLFIAESFASENGLGFFIMDAWSRVAYADLHCGVLCLALFGLGLFSLIDAVERISCPWRGL